MRYEFACFALVALATSPSFAAAPVLSSIMPRGAQRGAEVVITFGGARLADAQEIMAYSPGFQVTKLDAKDGAVQATIKIATDCKLGEHAFRVRTATGISDLKNFWVGALPVVDEKEPNNEFAKPQSIPLNCTVHGTVTSEDVDYFAVEAKKGQRISVEIEGVRVATDMGAGNVFDPYIAILDAKRFELATSDDTPLFRQDGCLSIVAPTDGRYVVQVRESSYQGNPGCHYRLHVGTFPRPMAIFPMGGRPGEEVEVRFLGDPAGEIKKKVKLPAERDTNFKLHAEDVGGISPSGLPFRVVDLPNVNEVEPNDAVATATKGGQAPCAFNGVIDKPGDIDFFSFAAKKGQVFDIHCYARRLGSPLDPVLYVYNDKGGALTGNDDMPGSPDSYVRFSVPADGEYLLSVTDHLKKGGPTYAYRVEVGPVQPRVGVNVPVFSLYTQDRQWVAIPKGNRYATLLSTVRQDWAGDLALAASGLPAKVTMLADPVPSFMSAVPVVFEAASDAPMTGTLADVQARPADAKAPPFRSSFGLRSDLVYGYPNLTPYWSYASPKVPVVVTDAAPFKINIVEPKVPLVHNGSMNLKIVAERNGYKGPITIYPLYNPPGVGSAGAATIPDGQNETVLPLNANGGAPARKWKYVVWGVATIGNGPVWLSSQLATIEIAPPMMAFQFDRGATEQGKPTTMFGKVQIATPWEGSAKVKLVGLPPKVTAPDVEVTKDTKELSFPLTVDATAPAGQHKNLYCQVVVTQNGEPIVQNVGSTELRIDKPLVAAAPAPAAKAQAAPVPAKSAEKRLSRLEQLRKEQEEREKGKKKE
jgi:hypothetical protein